MQILKNAFLWSILVFPSFSFGSTGNAQLWLDASINDYFKNYRTLHYALEAQTRFVDEKNYYELTFASGGLGYYYTQNLSFWMGYEWDSENEIKHTSAENILWEQMVWQIFENNTMTIRTRTRFEQINRMHEPQWNSQVRERITAFFPNQLFNKYTPIIYDEIFITFNNPSWENTQTFEQNRLFVGLAVPTSKTSFLEIGYIQQTLFIHDSDNAFNNILYAGINFNPSGQTIARYIK